MRLVWSQSSVRQDRRRHALLMGVVCVFLGGIVSGQVSEAPRPVRAAAASLLVTGGLFLVVGGVALAFPRGKRSGPALSLAPPGGASGRPEDVESAARMQEEEQR